MLDLEKIERLLQTGDLLDLEDEELSARLETFFQTQEERDRQISETLKTLLAEVDDLLVLSDDLELLDPHGR
jgi:CRISPR/Cas system-associated protein Csm6